MNRMGHNKGPAMEPGAGFRRYAWAQARNAVVKKHIPLEIVRMRVRRAAELGLAYPQYASILLGTGRDIVGFLFTCDALGLRLRRRLEMPAPVQQKLSGLKNCKLMGFAPSGEAPEAFRSELQAVSGLKISAAAAMPEDGAQWGDARRTIRAALDPLKLPGDAVVLVGSRDLEQDWAAAGGLAKYLPGPHYFGPAQSGATEPRVYR